MRLFRISILFVFAVLLTVSCGSYRETRHGVVVGKVRLEVVNDNVIRVSATDGMFPKDRSLIAAYRYPEKNWKVSSRDGMVVLATSSLRAVVNPQNGKVVFTEPDGTVILSERGRSFDGGLRQLWESGEDEAYYGLGQHQSDEFNWKDRNELLKQYNTKVSIPFVMSTRNYGILWDNYSMSRWGDARDYAHINEVFKVYDVTGTEGGLTGTYVPAPGRGETLVRTEPFLYFEHAKALEEFLPDIPLKGTEVTFEGALEPSQSGLFKFMLYYAGYTKVYVNDELVVPERWRTAWNPNTYKFECNMTAGEKSRIRIEWKPDGDVSYCSLRVLSPRDAQEDDSIGIWSEAGKQIDYYFVRGNNLDEVIGGYRAVTGKAQVMPRWAMGFWQCRERYKTQDELVSTFKTFRDMEIPIDNIVQDWFYWREAEWGSHEFDEQRYPQPKKMIDDIHGMNGHFMLSVWPKFYMTTKHFKEFDEKGWMYRRAVEDSIRDWVGPGYIGSFYDAYSADARKLFWRQMSDHLFPLGVDAWWMDASEPNVRDCVDMDYWKALCGPTALGSSTEYLNAYGLMNAQAIYEGQRSEAPDQRVFLLTRSGFAGLQRYSTAIWSGDIASRWEDMKAQIPAGINFSMAGIPYWTQDIGGFCVEDRYVAAFDLFNSTGVENEDLKEWRELNARWYQFGAFCPLFRVHGQYPYREIFNIAPKGHPAYNSILAYDKLRYRLMPYIYSLAGMTYFKDYTIMRGLAMDFEDDSSVYNVSDQYMFGPSIMVCPVYEYGARSREVVFPRHEGGWYDFYSGRHLADGVTAAADAPYEQIPLFVPAGSIIPFGPDMQYASEKPATVIDLSVYSGADGKFTLYEDEGTTYGYEKGEYLMIDIAYDEGSQSLVISEQKGTYPGAVTERTFNVKLMTPSGIRYATTTYSGSSVTLSL